MANRAGPQVLWAQREGEAPTCCVLDCSDGTLLASAIGLDAALDPEETAALRAVRTLDEARFGSVLADVYFFPEEAARTGGDEDGVFLCTQAYTFVEGVVDRGVDAAYFAPRRPSA